MYPRTFHLFALMWRPLVSVITTLQTGMACFTINIKPGDSYSIRIN